MRTSKWALALIVCLVVSILQVATPARATSAYVVNTTAGWNAGTKSHADTVTDSVLAAASTLQANATGGEYGVSFATRSSSPYISVADEWQAYNFDNLDAGWPINLAPGGGWPIGYGEPGDEMMPQYFNSSPPWTGDYLPGYHGNGSQGWGHYPFRFCPATCAIDNGYWSHSSANLSTVTYAFKVKMDSGSLTGSLSYGYSMFETEGNPYFTSSRSVIGTGDNGTHSGRPFFGYSKTAGHGTMWWSNPVAWDDGNWHTLVLRVNYGNGTADLWVDGADQGAQTDPNMATYNTFCNFQGGQAGCPTWPLATYQYSTIPFKFDDLLVAGRWWTPSEIGHYSIRGSYAHSSWWRSVVKNGASQIPSTIEVKYNASATEYVPYISVVDSVTHASLWNQTLPHASGDHNYTLTAGDQLAIGTHNWQVEVGLASPSGNATAVVSKVVVTLTSPPAPPAPPAPNPFQTAGSTMWLIAVVAIDIVVLVVVVSFTVSSVNKAFNRDESKPRADGREFSSWLESRRR